MIWIQNNFYEWGIYLPDQQLTSGQLIKGYQLLTRSSSGENRMLSLSIPPAIVVENQKDFDVFISGTMKDLSDSEVIPKHITYEKILQLARQIHNSRN